MLGNCKLCQKEAKLEVSHFIPKFVGKWIKKTSITGYLREVHEVKKRAQDTAKEHWLCAECEGLFSTWESCFAKEVFYPYVDDSEARANYAAWMSKFCASLSWRTLTFIRSKNTLETKTPEYTASLDAAERHLANYLLGDAANLNQYEQHVFPLDRIESTSESDLPANINRYFLRVIAMDIVGNSENYFIYTKLPSFIILGAVKSHELNKMRSSRIGLRSGRLSPRKYVFPTGLMEYISDKAIMIKEAQAKIPKHQQDKINDQVLKNPEKTVNSKQFEAFMHDYNHSGDKVFKK